MRVVEAAVGTKQFQPNFLQEAADGEPAELVRVLVPMEDAQASFQIRVYLPLLDSRTCSEQSRPS